MRWYQRFFRRKITESISMPSCVSISIKRLAIWWLVV